MAPVIHACVENTEILAMECAVPDVYQGHVIDIVEPVLMDVDQIGRESIALMKESTECIDIFDKMCRENCLLSFFAPFVSATKSFIKHVILYK